MTDFLAELRRRHIYRIAAVYVVIAWGIAQVVDLLSQTFALPDWIAQPLLIVLGLGLPVVLIASWMIVGAAKAGETPAELKKATATDWVLASALIVVIALIGYQQFAPSNVAIVDARATAAAEDIVAEVADRLPNSVAVLPFDNVSPDPDDAYFAIGVHDEILNKLSKIRSLAVIARGSVMQYAGTILPIPQIAQELNVEMVMTGTVRLAGDQVRVTAQLIDGMTNLPVWTTEDDGDLSDIFAIQSDIAMSIANSLQAQFSAEEQESVEARPTDVPEAYTVYLRALGLAREGIRGNGTQGRRAATLELLDQAVRLDPQFASAYAWKAYVYVLSRQFDFVAEEDLLAFHSETDRLVLENANMALTLDPSIGLAHTALAMMYDQNDQYDLALAEAEEALQLTLNDTEAVVFAASAKAYIGNQFNEAIAILESTAQRDPNNFLVYQFLSNFFIDSRRLDEAVVASQRCLEVGGNAACARQLALAELGRGNEEAALAATRLAEQLSNGGANTFAIGAYLYGRLGEAGEAQRMIQELNQVAESGYIDPLLWAFVYIGTGDYDAAFNIISENIDRTTFTMNYIKSNIFGDPALEEPGWVELRDQIRLRE